MHLRYYLDKDGKRPNGECTLNAHPARFSPDDKFQKERIDLKKRFNLLPTQQEKLKL